MPACPVLKPWAATWVNAKRPDRADRHPEAHSPGHLIRGGYRGGKLWLDTKVPAA